MRTDDLIEVWETETAGWAFASRSEAVPHLAVTSDVETVSRCGAHPDPTVRCRVVDHPSCPAVLIDLLATDGDLTVVAAVAGSSRLTAKAATLIAARRIAVDVLVRNPRCPTFVLEQFAAAVPSVRDGVAANPNTSVSTLTVLAGHHRHKTVIAANPAIGPDEVTAVLTGEPVGVISDRLLDGPQRRKVQVAALSNPAVTFDDLLFDSDDDDHVAAVASRPDCPERLLVLTATRCGRGEAERLVACHHVPDPVLAVLAARFPGLHPKIGEHPNTADQTQAVIQQTADRLMTGLC